MSITRHKFTARMSGLVTHRGVAYLSGQVPLDATDIRGQTAQVLRKIDDLLVLGGLDKSRLLTAQIFLADVADFAAMNEVWDAWLQADCAPARTTVQAALANPAYKVEITVTAAADEAAAN